MNAIGTNTVKKREFREKRLAEIVEQPDQQRPDQRPSQAAEPADDHHDEGEDQRVEIRAGIEAEHRPGENAAQRRERRAGAKTSVNSSETLMPSPRAISASSTPARSMVPRRVCS